MLCFEVGHFLPCACFTMCVLCDRVWGSVGGGGLGLSTDLFCCYVPALRDLRSATIVSCQTPPIGPRFLEPELGKMLSKGYAC